MTKLPIQQQTTTKAYFQYFPLSYQHPSQQRLEYGVNGLADVLEQHHVAVADGALDAVEVVALC